MSELNGKRNALVVQYMGYARKIVHSFSLSQLLEPQDAISEGYIGLIDACDKWDASKGMSLKNYIGLKIRWHLTDYIRDQKILKRRSSLKMVDLPSTILFSDIGSESDKYFDPIDDTALATMERSVEVESLIRLLGNESRLRVRMRLNDMTLDAIGLDRGVTGSAICQTFKYAVNKIQRAMI